jgi:voltage-dependent calcium channel N type alpha-1B
VFYIILFCFFLLNLFVGVVVITFNEQKEKTGKNFLLTLHQKEWLQLETKLLNSRPLMKRFLKSGNLLKSFCFKLVQSKYFEICIFICINLNTLMLTLYWYEMPQVISDVVKYLNYGFAGIFTLEAIVKIVAHGRGYF